MKKIRWGIVSAGTIANTFAADMVHVTNAEVAAVAARSQDSANHFASKYDIGKAYQGYEKLLSDPDIDAVYIGTPHTLHLQNSADSLRAGKAVLCEKPITTSAAECQKLLDVAAETGSYLMEAMWTWFLPALNKAKAWVDAGRIGELRHVKAELGYPKSYDPHSRLYDTALAGGCLLDMGIYPIAIARYFTEKPPDDMHVVSHHAPNGVDDDVAMLFSYNNCIATLATSFRCKLPNTAYIIGTEGYIEIPHGWSARECHLYAMHEQIDSFMDNRRGSGFEFQIEAVSNDILQGRMESAIVTHAASLAFQQDMDRVRDKF
ncbi:MAG: Gfo/Idh/MocA family oxidoreductase [Woeseiaceae bacterium]|nr:Gfo/Idh/MocA family oxidoreductase [Woeseiaceae bacterium]